MNPDWEYKALGEVVDILDRQRVPVSAKERAARTGTVPYYGATGQVGTIDSAIFDESLVLLGEDGVQFFDPLKPKAYLIDGPTWVNNHAHVLRARKNIDRCFLAHYLNYFDYRGYANGTTRLKLTQAAMKTILIPIPSLDEQRRIVAETEKFLEKLQVATQNLNLASARISAFTSTLLRQAIPDGRDYPAHWQKSTIGESGTVELGRQRHPD